MMDAGRGLRAMGWAVAALLGFVVLTYLALVAINWNDEPPSGEAERMVAMVRDRPTLDDAANGYIHALGLAAALDADPLALGSARNAYIGSWVAPVDATGMSGWPGQDVDYQAARSPEVAALATACGEVTACMEALAAGPAAVAQWLESERWLLERYRRMLATGTWREAIPVDPATPLLGYSHVLQGQKLQLLAARQQALAGDAAGVRELLERDLVFWREVLASSSLLVSRMVAVAAVERNFAFGNLALRELPPGLADAAVPPSWRQPLTVAERSIARSLAGEWHFMNGAIRSLMAMRADKDALWWRTVERLQRPLFQPQATLNLFAARMVESGGVSELPYPELAPALDAMARPEDGALEWLRPYNIVGRVLDSTVAGAAYSDYIARAPDLEGKRRATLLAAGLRAAGIAREGAAEAVRASSLRSPYDDAPLEWDAAHGAVVFRGLARGERGMYAAAL